MLLLLLSTDVHDFQQNFFTHLWLSFPMELHAVHNVSDTPHPSPGSNVNKVTAGRRTTSRLGTRVLPHSGLCGMRDYPNSTLAGRSD